LLKTFKSFNVNGEVQDFKSFNALTAVQGSKVQKFNGRIQDKERFQWFQWFQSFQLDGAYV
jgi:hypothetical protein